MPKAQGSLEYVIIIGGVIILAAATYFMLRGFAQTTGAGTTETIGVAGEKYMLELENLGRSETKFSAKKWTNPLLSRRTLMEFSSLGDVEFNATNLTTHGVQVSSLEFYFFDTSFHELNYTISGEILTVHTGSACCATDFDLYMFYNNFTAFINPCLANYTGPPRTSCVTIPLPDSSPPTISMSSTAYGSAGSVVDAKINVTVNGTGSNVSEVYYRIDDSAWFPVDNLYYGQGGITAEAHPVDGQYNEELEIIRITLTVPSEDNYTVRILARDEYGNEGLEEENVSVEVGTGPPEPPPEPQPGYFNLSLYLTTIKLSGSSDNDVFSFFRNATAWVQHQNITKDGSGLDEYRTAIDFGYNDSAYSAVAIYDWYDGAFGINYSFFDSGTNQWSEIGTLTETSTFYPDYFIDVAFDLESNAMAVWCDADATGTVVRSAFWNNSTQEWTNITVSEDDCDYTTLSVDFDSEGKAIAVWIAWLGTVQTLRYATFESGSWSSAQSIFSQGYLESPSFAFNQSDDGIVVWQQGTNPTQEISYSLYDSGSETWSSPLNITDNSVSDIVPMVGIDVNGDPVAVWISEFSGPGAYFNYSVYSGGSWTSGTIETDKYCISSELYQDFNNKIMAVCIYGGAEIHAWFWDGSTWSSYELIGYVYLPM